MEDGGPTANLIFAVVLFLDIFFFGFGAASRQLNSKEIEKRGLDCEIEVDGGINEKTIAIAAKAGADVFVSGSAIFSSADRKGTIEKFKKIAEENYCK